MATSTTALTDILNYVKTWKSNTFKIEAYKVYATSPSSDPTDFITNATATYGEPNYVGSSVGVRIALTSNVVLQIPANKTVKALGIFKGTLTTHGNDMLYIKEITPEVFTYAGTITITSATITLNDA